VTSRPVGAVAVGDHAPRDRPGDEDPAVRGEDPAEVVVALPARARERPLVVICRSGNRSRRAAELLTAGGAKAVDVIGGMLEWAEAGLPVVDSKGLRGTVA
jgi:rhodanese-related sulfurtransferase